MELYCNVSNLSYGCGVSVINDFGGDDWDRPIRVKASYLGGANLAVATFIDNAVCRKAYDKLKEKFNIVYQAPPRRNANSGRQFFMVVYDGMKK